MSSQKRTLGSEIKQLRTEAKITLRKFADTIGISPAHQSDIEHDRRRPSPDVLKRIAKALRSVGATYETLDLLSTRLDPEVQEWVAETPSARQMLRAVRDSGRDPREVLKQIQELLSNEKKERT